MGKELLALLPILLVAFVPLASGECLQNQDNATVPNCFDWIGPNNEPYFFPHQYNCSRYWECNVAISPAYPACLRECGKGYNHTVLYYDETVKPGPTCNYPEWTNCTNKSPECAICEAWQTCTVLDDGTVTCSPDCVKDQHCDGPGCPECINGHCVDPECCTDADCPDNYVCEDGKCHGCLSDDDCDSDEYCDNGACKLGCRDDSGCNVMECSTCENHVCVDPECCADKDCASNEFCNAQQICQEGCNENSDCTDTDCSSCDMNSNTCVNPECCGDEDCNGMVCSTCDNLVCHDPECCTDEDCAANEFCNAQQMCQEGCNENSDCTTMDCSTCDMNTNSCVDPECCVDDDCQGGWICENGVCGPECLVDTDCEDNEYCNTVEGICKEGCRDSPDNCNAMSCSTCVDHVCHDPECCVDDDCKSLDEPVCYNEECIPGCRSDEMCPGVDEICDNAYSNCQWCNMTGSATDDIGYCDNGCAANSNCAGVMSCSSHQCITASFNSLKSIYFTTDKCDGCGSSSSEPWLSMFLVGKADKNGPNNCTTDILDHAGEIDYKPGNQVSFEGELDKDVLGDCYQKNLQGEVHMVRVTWKGTGTWAPKNQEVTFTMSDPNSFEFVCKLNKNELSPSQDTAEGDCSEQFKIKP